MNFVTASNERRVGLLENAELLKNRLYYHENSSSTQILHLIKVILFERSGPEKEIAKIPIKIYLY
jgi:hypothetical protein